MSKTLSAFALIGFLFFFLGCKKKENLNDIDYQLNSRYQKLLEYPVDSIGFPRSMTFNPDKIIKVTSGDWTSGFFPGNLWQLHRLTRREEYKEKAIQWTSFLEGQKYNDKTHDMGFKIYCSYGEGYKNTNNPAYKNVIITSAKTLITRFNKNVGCIRSWDFNKDKWEYPVIIDNMMNLELLFEATKITGDSTYHKIAVTHANHTLKNHIRDNNSVYHVVVYDTITGNVKQKITHQGFHDESSWSRGQAWCVYGFTMAYRYTKDKKYLDQAIATSNFFINHKNLPEDGIPYWDFNAPGIPNAPKDVSAATILSSSLFELYSYTNDEKILGFAKKVLKSLMTDEYVLEENIQAPFILRHSTGNWPKEDEIDVPLVYADYYFLEALLRSINYK
ncbi:glycoside hydrolase family 88 protein [Abyssalbus ytuae]|uniref:Glycoside hydrolase family 88 protein n=1 Tax=Abyssalbus ytuae TaxID=2926907 RepID=A0A9E7CTB0_9FLAO|nr:glycoside hydrolase family 88 protein [Abyssalbus ytuae]UOB17801.1 glycoside hydrolase family 88 protein [Abyssalbus ytuae]